MRDKLGKSAWSLLALAVALGVVWLASKLLLSAAKLGLLAALVLFTVGVAGPDFRAVTGFGLGPSKRPWLVRLREHRWAAVWTPFGRPLPRLAAYAAIVFGWWWLLF